MMDSNFHSEPLRLNDLVGELVTHHGAWRVLRVLVAHLATRRHQRPRVDHMSDHLRRDVGLAPGRPPPGLRDPRL